MRRILPVVIVLAVAASSCAYYNTYYLAKKYYDLATLKQPYLVDRDHIADPGGTSQNFRKSIDYSKKVLAQYAKSKWVDDAYLLWARSLLFDDPLQTVNMLGDFTVRYPKSSVTPEARFYLGVAYRQAHKYKDALATLDEFLSKHPKHNLVPYAHLERSRVLGSLNRWQEAAEAAEQTVQKARTPLLVQLARTTHADAAFHQGDYAAARADYLVLERQSRDDEERLKYVFLEADCLEAARQYDEELRLLTSAQSHEIPPPPQDNTPGAPAPPPPPNDRFGRIEIRIGTVHLLAGHLVPALDAYRSVIHGYPRTPIAAEAQYRVGYAYETVADDFTRAKEEYAKVKDVGAGNVSFTAQSVTRANNLARIIQFKGGRDTVATKAEAQFLLAEQYLFQLDKPDRALQEYQRIAQQFQGTPWEAKAMVAEAWVLSRKLNQRREADSLWWEVVYRHAATEGQLAARDYLERDGATVPDSLIKLPEKPLLAEVPDSSLTQPPAGADSLGLHRTGGGRLGGGDENLRTRGIRNRRASPVDSTATPAAADTSAKAGLPWTPPDTSSVLRPPPNPLLPPAPPDTTRRPHR